MKQEKGKRLRDMSWSDYGISPHRYRELKNFCLQYEEKKEKIKRHISAVPMEMMTGAQASLYRKSAVEDQAILNVQLIKDCEMIEQAAMEANMEIHRYIIKSAIHDLSYNYVEYDRDLGRIPVGKTDFHAYKRLFYYILHKKKLGTN